MTHPALERIADAAGAGEFLTEEVQVICDLLDAARQTLKLSKEVHCKLALHEIESALDELTDETDEEDEDDGDRFDVAGGGQ